MTTPYREALERAKDEVIGKLSEVLPILEGLADYARLNISDAARVAVEERRGVLTPYSEQLNVLRQQLEAVLGMGEPDLDTVALEHLALADMDEQIRTIMAARSRFQSIPEATRLDVRPG